MSNYVAAQVFDAYRSMADHARYRPSAPSDGFGNVTVPAEDLDLAGESESYMRRWWSEEGDHSFWIGCCDSRTRSATIYAVEAARCMCGCAPEVALRLLELAVADLKQQAGVRGRKRRTESRRRVRSVTQAMRREVFLRDGERCLNCGSSEDLHIDHIIPFSDGGQCEVDNLQTLCRDCNIRKGVRFLDLRSAA